MISSLLASAEQGYTPLPESETRRLIRRAQQPGRAGRLAMNELIHRNILLVLKVVSRFRGLATPTCAEDDMEQAALYGLMRAVRLFNLRRGCRFSTYAVHCMRRHVMRTIANDAGELRISINRQLQRYYIRRAVDDFTARSGAAPTRRQIARRTGLSAAQIEAAETVPIVAFSLDDNHSEWEDTTRGDVLPDPDTELPEYIPHDRGRIVQYLKQILPERLCDVVVLHYGLHPEHPQGLTFKELGVHFGFTRQRAQQLLLEALRILRQPSHKWMLAQLLDRRH